MSDVQIPEKFKTLVESIEKMSALDLAELVKLLEEKFAVSAAAPMMMAAPAAAGTSPEVLTEEKTSFIVELTESGANKIGVIKVIREVTGLGLKDAKDLVDAAPKVVKENVSKTEAEEMKKKIEEAGGKAIIK